METSSDKDAILALLKRYRSGQCTPEEIARVEAWFDSFEDRQPVTPEMTDAANEAVTAVMKQLFPRRRTFSFTRLSVAASALLLLAAGLFFLLKGRQRTPVPVTFSEINTGSGERKKLTLPDGTVLTMNAHSSLKIPSDFGKQKRELFLSGQGTFEVVSNVSRPFIVHTGKVQTIVLGTSFDVRAYPGDKELQVAVLNGKVKVETGEKVLAASVTQDQVLTYNEQRDSHQLKNGNAGEIAGWRANWFFFEQASIAEIAQLLERQYNVRITLTGTTKKSCRYTLQLKNEPIENALRLLAQLSGITYQVINNDIKINIASCE